MYLLTRVTRSCQENVLEVPNEFSVFAVHLNCRLSPSSKSKTRILSLDRCVSTLLISHDAKSPKVTQVFENMFNDAKGMFSGNLNICSASNFTSGFKLLPVHSTSCRLAIPLKSRDVSPGRQARST